VAPPCGAQDIALQGVQQGALAAAAQQEVGAGLQVFLQLSACFGRWRLDRALAHAGLPERQGDQRGERHQRLGEIAHQQGEQVVHVAIEQQAHVGALVEVPQQPGVIVLADSRGFP